MIKNKKETLISIFLLLFIVIVVIGITYAAFTYTGLGTKSNKVTTSTITMNYNEATNGITLTDAFPISDNDGKQLTGEGRTFTFTVTITTGNYTAVGYEVSAVKDPTSTLGNNDVRIYLEKSTSGAEGTYNEVLAPTGFSPINATTEIGTPAGEMLLHSDSTTNTRTDYYILRMWVAENYQITGESKFFTIKVNVYGTDSHINTSGISLNKNSMELDEGESEQLSATVLPDYTTNKSVTWVSSNTNVAVVDSEGNVTAQSIPGTTASATITVTDANGHSASCVVTVNKPEPTGVEVVGAPEEIELITGGDTILEAGTLPANANSNEVEWTTSDSSVLDIERYTEANASGTGSSKSVVANKVRVRAVRTGTATLTVKSASNPSATPKSITVTIQDPESTGLTIDKPTVTIDRNSNTTITTTLNLSNSRDKTIYWTNSDSTKASISCSGGSTNSSGEIETSSASAVCTVTGLVAGSTTITARDAKGHTATSVVTVQNELASSVSLSSDAEIEVGASHIFQASITPSDARDISSITWSSSNTTVATIPQNCAGSITCEITGSTVGTTNITVTIGSLNDTSQLEVVDNKIPVTDLSVGDYVQMTPSYIGSYTPTTDSSSPYYTGTSSPGSVTPSELTKWVIIKDYNTDGIIEMVSLNASSTTITFYGQIGYNNYVGALNKIAEQYRNNTFTNASRHMGYLAGSSLEQCNSCGTDNYYITDVDLVKNAIGVRGSATEITTRLNSDNTFYFLASRFVSGNGYCRCLSYVWSDVGGAYNGPNCSMNVVNTLSSTKYTEISSAVRIILSLKPSAKAAAGATGDVNNPYVLVE